MITIDQTTLSDLGIELGDATPELLAHMDEQLNLRVAAALLELLDDEQATEYIKLSEAGDNTATLAWVQTNIPDYKDVIQDEVDILLGELAQSSSASSEEA